MINVYKGHRLIFIDETGTNTTMTRSYARSSIGERAICSAPVNYGNNVTIIGALDLGGIVAAMSINGSADGDVFITFVREVLVPELRPNDVVIMDNLNVHKNFEVEKVINEAGSLLIFLPPYSPDFNPIEQCWSKVKAYLRSIEARTCGALDQAITDAINSITSEDAYGWFSHSGYRIHYLMEML